MPERVVVSSHQDVVIKDGFVPAPTEQSLKSFVAKRRQLEEESRSRSDAGEITDDELAEWMEQKIRADWAFNFDPQFHDPVGWETLQECRGLIDKHPLSTDGMGWLVEKNPDGSKAHTYFVKRRRDEPFSKALVKGVSGLCKYVDKPGASFDDNRRMMAYQKAQSTRAALKKAWVGHLSDDEEANWLYNQQMSSLSQYEKTDLEFALRGGLTEEAMMAYWESDEGAAAHGSRVHLQIHRYLSGKPFDASLKEMRMLFDLQKRDARFAKELVFRTEMDVGTYLSDGRDLVRFGGKLDAAYYRGPDRPNEYMLVDWKCKQSLMTKTKPDEEFGLLFPEYQGFDYERLGLQLHGYKRAFEILMRASENPEARVTKLVIVLFPTDGVGTHARIYEVVFNPWILVYIDFCRVREHKIAMSEATGRFYDAKLETARFMEDFARRVRAENPNARAEMLFPGASNSASGADANKAKSFADVVRKRRRQQEEDETRKKQ